LYNELDDKEKEKLLNLHAKKPTESELLWMKAKMQEHKTIEKSFHLAQKLSNEAKNALKDDEALVNILDTMIKRSY
jgi:octaprenyl-diphosphate synthase